MLLAPPQALALEVNKRKRGEQHEPPVPRISPNRLPNSDTIRVLSHHSSLFFPHIPNSIYRPPFSLDFIETLNSLCHLESQLNMSSTFDEIKNIQIEIGSLYHRIFDQPSHTFGLFLRIENLEFNVKFKLLRCCHAIIRNAAQLADDIQSIRFRPSTSAQPPSDSLLQFTLSTADKVAFMLHDELSPLKTVYLFDIRPILIRYWADDSSDSDFDIDLDFASASELRLPPS